ncbi:trehalose-6-phosphate synthase [Luteimonas sp. MJ204]|uniref:alpha,alpha-trehalose-phosphate synthase (UDP-forming) n=1 Tax=Luteimonas sp. MJ145 TaxID=3129234 RepID=UPI0031BBBA62
MSRLVIVSNRVAVPGQSRSGGLVVALDGALRATGGVWFGWSGKTSRDGTRGLSSTSEGNVDYVTMDLTEADVSGYYDGFSNRTLWPALHYRLDLVEYSRETHVAYRQVNAQFAERLAALLRPDDRVWIHDYHLLPLAGELRARGVENPLALFLHVPFPPSDLARALPNHDSVFGAMSAYDLVGFQTRRDCENFDAYLRDAADAGEHAPGRRDRRPLTRAFPISIDEGEFARAAARARGSAGLRSLRDSLGGSALAIGVDRLDYSKGLAEKFQAFGEFLRRHPTNAGGLTLLQIAPLSRSGVRSYRELRRELEQIAGHINGEHANPQWTPIRYVNRNLGRQTLAGFFSASRLGLVTPLRDGMNLVAKEYVAAQDPDDPGVLLLSRFAGAAEQLGGALLVNPYDIGGVANAIAAALRLDVAERRERHLQSLRSLQEEGIHWWTSSFLQALESRANGDGPAAAARDAPPRRP